MRFSLYIVVLNFILCLARESDLFILDENGRTVHDVIGPLNEGSRLSLLCEANGGVPSIVTWWKGSALLDDSFVSMPRGIIQNELTLSYLDRGDLMSTLKCQASSPNVTAPSETSVSLDLNLKPLVVHITSLQRPLSAGRQSVLWCQTSGSRPPAKLTWWIGSRQLLNASEITHNTTTIAKLFYLPSAEDHGKVLSCRATNPVMNGHILEDHRILNIYYIPQTSVTVGTPQPRISEGDDVYFDCNVDSNPPVTEVGWRFNDAPLYGNVAAGIKIQNRSLLLRKINKKNSGEYSCVAANSEGESVSESVTIDVHYLPFCVPSQRFSYAVGLGETLKVHCHVEANPDTVEFYWFLNSTRQIELQDFVVNGTWSTLTFTPKRKSDYGQLLCQTRNAIGFQKEACCFHFTPASVPDAVENCFVTNETETTAIVSCLPGWNGGLPQIFHLELYSTKGLEASFIDEDTPYFEATDLPPGKSLVAVIFATNERGRGNSVALTVITKSDKKQGKGATMWPISPVLGALIAIIGILVIIAVGIVLYTKHWSAKLGENVQETPAAWEHGEMKPGHQYI